MLNRGETAYNVCPNYNVYEKNSALVKYSRYTSIHICYSDMHRIKVKFSEQCNTYCLIVYKSIYMNCNLIKFNNSAKSVILISSTRIISFPLRF